MPNEKAPRIPSVVPLVIAAIVTATAVVACDHSGTRAGAPDNFAANAHSSQGTAAVQTADSAVTDAKPLSPLPPRDSLNDTVITSKIKAAILADPGMAGADVSVNTDRGVVVLTGIAKSGEQIALASAHAQRQDGVMRVDTHLNVNQ